MADKMTVCKTCGKEIAKSADICPNCGAKQAPVRKIFARILLVIALFILFIALIGSCVGGEDTPKPVDKSGDTKSASASTVAPASEKTTFGIGESAEMNDVVVTLKSVEQNTGKDFFAPQDGYVFVVCEFEIENNSNSDIAVSSLMSFEAYFDDYSTSISITGLGSTDKKQLDGTIAGGKKMNGIVAYEVPADWKEMDIRFTDSVWRSNKFIFTATNGN